MISRGIVAPERVLAQVLVLNGIIDLVIEPLLVVGFTRGMRKLKNHVLVQAGFHGRAHWSRGCYLFLSHASENGATWFYFGSQFPFRPLLVFRKQGKDFMMTSCFC